MLRLIRLEQFLDDVVSEHVSHQRLLLLDLIFDYLVVQKLGLWVVSFQFGLNPARHGLVSTALIDFHHHDGQRQVGIKLDSLFEFLNAIRRL